jgi:hypothetical protein
MDKKLLGSAAFKVKGRHIPRRHTGLLEPKKRWEKSALQPDLLQKSIRPDHVTTLKHHICPILLKS